MDCQICMETIAQDNLHKVCCNSPVDHLICFDCESKWRSKMLVRDGTRVMTCPTCRQPELERTKDSMQRELNKYYAKSQSQVSIEQLSELVQLAFSRMTTSDQAQLLREVQGTVRPVQVIQIGAVQLAEMAQPSAAQAEEISLMARVSAQVEARQSVRRRHAEAVQRRAEARAEEQAATQRRAAAVQAHVEAHVRQRQAQTEAPAPRPVQLYCSSGRDCHSRSRTHNRTKTHLKCRNCNEVPCCMNCKTCTTCV
jgi:hypothetical protein